MRLVVVLFFSILTISTTALAANPECQNVTLYYQQDTPASYAKWDDIREPLLKVLEDGGFKISSIKPFDGSFDQTKESGMVLSLYFNAELRGGDKRVQIGAEIYSRGKEVSHTVLTKRGDQVLLASNHILEALRSNILFGTCP